MAARILDGRDLAARIQAGVKGAVGEAVAAGRRPPGLAVVRVGDDPASAVYVRNKERSCQELGMVSRGAHMGADSTEEEIGTEIDRLNADPGVDGILLQLPLPPGRNVSRLLERIDPRKDVDGFHPDNGGRLLSGQPRFVPCTPRGIMELLAAYEVPLRGSRAVVVGRSNIVGKPMALLLLAADATVTLCHSRTRDLEAVTREADVLVSATGVPASVRASGVKPGAVVVDVGINRVDDAALVERAVRDPKRLADFRQKGSLLIGDVCFDEVKEVAGAITPVPGGVGPLTVALLMKSTWESWRRREGLGS
ncbi:MAG: bifunctional methylenetetrahydrofolate dehydrogenase/methenyltetrahydrofolate cyclohydrolase FolD [Acidobacteriota bacterium]